MVLFTLVMVAPRGRGPAMISALRSLRAQTQNVSGCLGCRLSADADAADIVHYSEQWATERDLWTHVRSERFGRLIALMETAAEQPRVAVHLVSRAFGFEYIKDVLRSGRP